MPDDEQVGSVRPVEQGILRAVRADDLAALRLWESDPTVAAWMTTTASRFDARESAEQEYDRLVRTPRVKLLVIQLVAGEVVGFIRLNDLDMHARKATLRILIGPRWQGQGYGSAALRQLIGYCFDELGLRRLGLVVRADNARALGVYQRLGFVAEGRERDAAWVNGHWIDFIHMGLLAPDWRDERADPMVGYVAGAELTQAVAHPTTPKREGE